MLKTFLLNVVAKCLILQHLFSANFMLHSFCCGKLLEMAKLQAHDYPFKLLCDDTYCTRLFSMTAVLMIHKRESKVFMPKACYEVMAQICSKSAAIWKTCMLLNIAEFA